MKIRGGMNELMRQASRLQRKVEKRKEELKEEVMEVTSGNGQIKVTVNGGQELLGIEIDPELLAKEDLSMVQDMIVATTNAALNKSKDMLEAEVNKVTGGVHIPGIM